MSTKGFQCVYRLKMETTSEKEKCKGRDEQTLESYRCEIGKTSVFLEITERRNLWKFYMLVAILILNENNKLLQFITTKGEQEELQVQEDLDELKDDKIMIYLFFKISFMLY